ncbi:MAG: MBL fold metallo-hydrolase [Acidilobus sp.]
MASRLQGNTYLERGSPATLIYVEGKTGYVIDPGQGEDRPKRIQKALRDLGVERVVVMLTHYHSDHVEAVEGISPSEVVASARDAPMVRDPELRILSTFNYPLSAADSLLPFRAVPVRVTRELNDQEEGYGPIGAVRLPGHTEGHLGYVTPDGVLYAGDAIFGDRVLEKYGVPYHKFPCQAEESLRSLGSTANRYELIVPGHGPVVRGPEAGPLIDLNIGSIRRFSELVEQALRTPSGVHEVVAAIVRQYPGASWTPDNLMLLEASVKGLLRCLRARGLVTQEVVEGSLKWRVQA